MFDIGKLPEGYYVIKYEHDGLVLFREDNKRVAKFDEDTEHKVHEVAKLDMQHRISTGNEKATFARMLAEIFEDFSPRRVA